MSNSAQARATHGRNDTMRSSIEPDETLPPLHLADRLLSSTADGFDTTQENPADVAALRSVALWAKDFLTKPHPALGRSGHVCPFVNAAIREQRFLLTVQRDADAFQRRAERVIRRLGRYFLQLDPRASQKAQLNTIVVLFPDLPKERAGDIVNDVHRRLKPSFLSRGMMLGEFFAESSKPGLHNPAFRPLRSDVPLLVIRSMMLTDIAFLSDRARFVRAFLRNFGPRGCTEVRSYLETAKGSLSESQVSMLLEQVARYEASVRQAEQLRTSDHTLQLTAPGRAVSYIREIATVPQKKRRLPAV